LGGLFSVYPKEGGMRYGENYYERAGTILTDGNKLAESLSTRKIAGIPDHQGRHEDPDTDRGIP